MLVLPRTTSLCQLLWLKIICFKPVKPPNAFCKCFYFLIQVDQCPARDFLICADEFGSPQPVSSLSHVQLFLGSPCNVSSPAKPSLPMSKSTGSLMRERVKCHVYVHVYTHTCDRCPNTYACVDLYVRCNTIYIHTHTHYFKQTEKW